jgi:hypothetical protein
MAERKNTHGLKLRDRRGVALVDIGDMEIWDGADLSLIRDTLSRLIVKDKRRSIGVQMRHVKYVPSGFFGMLYDWFEQGIEVRLFAPLPRVQEMLWFKQFFELESDHCYVLCEGNGEYAGVCDAEVEGDAEAQWAAERVTTLDALGA